MNKTEKIARVDTFVSPSIHMFYSHQPVKIICDSGATSSLIKHSLAVKLGMTISPTQHVANQADGKTRMTTMEEVDIILPRNDMKFPLKALVVKELDCDILAGVPFMRQNKIVLDLTNDRIVIDSKYNVSYREPPLIGNLGQSIKRTQPIVVRAEKQSVLYPGDYIELQSTSVQENTPIAIEPRADSFNCDWLEPTISECIGGVVRIPNLSTQPVLIRKHQHLAQIHYTTCGEGDSSDNYDMSASAPNQPQPPYSNDVKVDPQNQLTALEKRRFADLNKRYDNVFNKRIGKYNDASGRVRAYINMGPVEPPQHKAHL